MKDTELEERGRKHKDTEGEEQNNETATKTIPVDKGRLSSRVQKDTVYVC